MMKMGMSGQVWCGYTIKMKKLCIVIYSNGQKWYKAGCTRWDSIRHTSVHHLFFTRGNCLIIKELHTLTYISLQVNCPKTLGFNELRSKNLGKPYIQYVSRVCNVLKTSKIHPITYTYTSSKRYKVLKTSDLHRLNSHNVLLVSVLHPITYTTGLRIHRKNRVPVFGKY